MNKKRIKRYTKYAIVLLIGGLIGFFIKGKLMGNAAGRFGAAGPATVLVKTLQAQPYAHGKTFIARVEAINASDVTPQVSGYIDQVLFQDGSFVKEGDVLFVIDQSRYKAAVSSAEASLERTKAVLKQVQSDYHREKSLYNENMLSKADLELAESALATAQANVKAAQASLDLAKLDLDYTEVRSPISGYIGKALKTKGNLATAGVDKLARVIQMDPIRVVFSITDKERLSGMDQLATQTPDIQIALSNGEKIEMPSASLFSDNEVNAQTATMAVYAQTNNAANRLVPGNYVNVTVSTDKLRPVILIPQTAVSQDATGQFVMTVNPENIIVQKYVTLGDMVDGQYVVVSGLESGEKIVTIGQQKLQNGQQVTVSELSPVTVPEKQTDPQPEPVSAQPGTEEEPATEETK